MRNKDGYYINKYNVIYVQGTVDGIFYRKSTKKKATKDNLHYVKKNCRDVLLKLIDKEKVVKTSLESFGTLVIENSSNKRSLNQQRDVLSKFNNHILPTFKNFALTDIKVTDIENWQIKLLDKLSSSTVKKCREILNLILKKALADDIIVKDYAALADNIQVSSQRKEPYTEHELRLLIEHSTGWFNMYLVLVASSGLRPGEALGLQWEDIDLNNGFIDLKRSISKGKIIDETSLTNKTKNHQRIIPLDNTTRKELVKYYQDRPNDTWLFVNKHNTYFADGRSVNKYYWKPLLLKLNIKDKTMYALRHSFVTIMKNAGATDSWLKSVIGHKQSSKVMDDVYFTFNNEKHKIGNSNNFFSHIEVKKVQVG
jgi:integrase